MLQMAYLTVNDSENDNVPQNGEKGHLLLLMERLPRLDPGQSTC